MGGLYYAMDCSTVKAFEDKARAKIYKVKIGQTGRDFTERAREIFRKDNDIILKTWSFEGSEIFRRQVETTVQAIIEHSFTVKHIGNDHFLICSKAEVKAIEKKLDSIVKYAIDTQRAMIAGWH